MAPWLQLITPRELRTLLDAGTPAMVEFYSPECPHCAALEPTIEELAREWGDRVTIAQIDILEYPKLADEWTIMGTPTVLFFQSGKEVARLIGAQSERQYRRELQNLVQ